MKGDLEKGRQHRNRSSSTRGLPRGEGNYVIDLPQRDSPCQWRNLPSERSSFLSFVLKRQAPSSNERTVRDHFHANIAVRDYCSSRSTRLCCSVDAPGCTTCDRILRTKYQQRVLSIVLAIKFRTNVCNFFFNFHLSKIDEEESRFSSNLYQWLNVFQDLYSFERNSYQWSNVLRKTPTSESTFPRDFYSDPIFEKLATVTQHFEKNARSNVSKLSTIIPRLSKTLHQWFIFFRNYSVTHSPI